MALVKVVKPKIQKVLVTDKEQLLKLADEIAEGLSDAILEFFVAKEDIKRDARLVDATLQLDDYEGPDEENIAGIDNEYFEDEGEI
jgi:hypothetical protein